MSQTVKTWFVVVPVSLTIFEYSWSYLVWKMKMKKEATSACADIVPKAVHRPLLHHHLPTIHRVATIETKMWSERYEKQIYCGQKHTVRPYVLLTCNALSLIEASKLPVFPQWLRCSILFTRAWHREVHKNNCGECFRVRDVLCTGMSIFICLQWNRG